MKKQVTEIFGEMIFNGFCSGHSRQDSIATNMVGGLLDRNQFCEVVDSSFAATVGNLRDVWY
jgi:hypothetical protein